MAKYVQELQRSPSTHTRASVCERALLANANLAGDNCNRGMLVGALFGALFGDACVAERHVTRIVRADRVRASALALAAATAVPLSQTALPRDHEAKLRAIAYVMQQRDAPADALRFLRNTGGVRLRTSPAAPALMTCGPCAPEYASHPSTDARAGAMHVGVAARDRARALRALEEGSNGTELAEAAADDDDSDLDVPRQVHSAGALLPATALHEAAHDSDYAATRSLRAVLPPGTGFFYYPHVLDAAAHLQAATRDASQCVV